MNELSRLSALWLVSNEDPHAGCFPRHLPASVRKRQGKMSFSTDELGRGH